MDILTCMGRLSELKCDDLCALLCSVLGVEVGGQR